MKHRPGLLPTRGTLATVDIAAIRTVYPGFGRYWRLLLLSALVAAGCSPAGDNGGAGQSYSDSAPQVVADVKLSETGSGRRSGIQRALRGVSRAWGP